jgi:predicted CXXCH cytochrome family protein
MNYLHHATPFLVTAIRLAKVHCFSLSERIFILFVIFVLHALASTCCYASGNCVTTDCHSSMGKAEFVHGPVAGGKCDACHVETGSIHPGKDDAIELTDQGPALCFQCHDDPGEGKKHTHWPVEKDCHNCHDPHQSSRQFQLKWKGKGKVVNSLCNTCHDKATFSKKFQHGPVGDGECTSCHNPHASEFEQLLIAPKADGQVCFECHEEIRDFFLQKYVHPPVKEGCDLCHDPHSSDHKIQLHKAQADLCIECHEEENQKFYQDITNAKFKHAPVEEGRCADCHKPHSSNYKFFLKASPEIFCLMCHYQIERIIQDAKSQHDPVAKRECLICHVPHAGDYVSLLVSYYPKNTYIRYRDENFALCFNCHESDAFTLKQTTAATHFRNTDQNLHYLHVYRSKGRVCTNCHGIHGADLPKLIHSRSPAFGAWNIPINIIMTGTGATCFVGCHKKKSYDRIVKIDNR